MEPVIRINNVSKKFGTQCALQHINLNIKPGEIYGLIGRNGAGKTTLLKLITKLIHLNDGSISLFGSQSEREWEQNLKHVGCVLESPVAHQHLSAYDNLRYYCIVYGIQNAGQVINETLAYVGLSDTGNKPFRSFSLGMKQRLGIAIAILTKPDLLILDEPINGLDPVGIIQFRQMIERLNEETNMTIIISSHILTELYQVATKFGILEQGRLIKEITKADFETLNDQYIVLKTTQLALASQVLTAQLNLQLKVVNQSNELHIFAAADQIQTIIQALTQENIVIDEIYYEKESLEAYFTSLIN